MSHSVKRKFFLFFKTSFAKNVQLVSQSFYFFNFKIFDLGFRCSYKTLYICFWLYLLLFEIFKVQNIFSSLRKI